MKQTKKSPSRNYAGATARSIGKAAWKILLSALIVVAVVGVVTGIFLLRYVLGLKDTTVDFELESLQLNYASFVYMMDEEGNPVEYTRLYGTGGNRIWVSFDQIPQDMKDAMIAIEDKRFEEHNGVDWVRTFGAVTNLFSGGGYGGSTLTQQLIKNITGDNEVSINRKVTEIFRALNLEKKYTKDQILEAYLNVVNFGAGTQGVQAAANLYFGKDIADCTLAECAAIAGITQNPYKYNPLAFPENNKERQQTVLFEMLDQGKISQAEYDEAMAQSENMVFVGDTGDDDDDEVEIYNWYVDAMIADVVDDLQEARGISEQEAVNMVYYNGLKIYCAMDSTVQTVAEQAFAESSILDADPALQAGFYMMDYEGRVLAIVGSTSEKTGNRLFNYATDAVRQSGSTMKPISVYATAMEEGVINYSALVDDSPLPNYFNDGRPGPNNANGRFQGMVTTEYALQWSLNAPAAQLCNMISPEECYAFLTQKLHFTTLNDKVDQHSISAMSLGGLNQGVTVKEMTAAFQIFGNQGKYVEPYTYYYVEDHDGNVILDNRYNAENATQAMRPGAAGAMNKLLQNATTYGTGSRAKIWNWEMYGKTGTTDINDNSWYIGGTPYAVAGVWTGYKNPAEIRGASLNAAMTLWKTAMTEYLEGKQHINFTYSDDLVARSYCTQSGLLAGSGCTSVKTGWYESDRLPSVCNAQHVSQNSQVESEPSSDVSGGETVSDPSGLSSEGSSGSSSSQTSSSPTIPPVSSSGSTTEPTPSTPETGGGEGGGNTTEDPQPPTDELPAAG